MATTGSRNDKLEGLLISYSLKTDTNNMNYAYE